MKLKVNPYLGFNDIPFMLLGIPLMGMLIPIVFFQVEPFGEGVQAGYFIGSTLYTACYWVVDRFIIIWMRKRYPGLKNLQKRITVTSVIILFYTLSFCNVGIAFINPIMGKGDIAVLDNLTAFDYNVASLTVTVTVNAIYETLYMLYLYRNQLFESERLKKENLRSQLDALKSQVNPHFLFNSLNTLASVIPEDPKLAVEFVQKLSKVYRYILEIRDKELISIRDELDCIEAFSFLLNIRFGSNLKVDLDIPKELQNQFILPLSMQMLFENAIKHNVVSQRRPLHIKVSVLDNNCVLVSNNIQLKSQQEISTKTGLENIKRRYKLLTEKEVTVRELAGNFEVLLPIINVGKA